MGLKDDGIAEPKIEQNIDGASTRPQIIEPEVSCWSNYNLFKLYLQSCTICH